MKEARKRVQVGIIAIFTDARERVADVARWCRGVYAVDEDGQSTGPMEENACAWCLVGALFKAAGFCGDDDCEQCIENGAKDDAHAALDVLRAHAPDPAREQGVDVWQDTPATTHADILAALDVAIANRTAWEAEHPHGQRQQPVCATCGSPKLMFQGWVKWDVEAQDFRTSQDMLDENKRPWCEDCEDETRDEWREMR